MIPEGSGQPNEIIHHPVARYYRLHSRIYDATRWSFLFGRNQLMKIIAVAKNSDLFTRHPDSLPESGARGTKDEIFGNQYISDGAQPFRILDIGCGTGDNLLRLCREFPTAEITGLDLSEAMLSEAEKKLKNQGCRVDLVHRAYDQPLAPAAPFDLLVFSYSLSMFNPGWEQAIDCAYLELERGGLIAVVDFHYSRFSLFKGWMALNHVRLEGHLIPRLESRFRPEICQLYPAYGGIWSYFLFLGKKTI